MVLILKANYKYFWDIFSGINGFQVPDDCHVAFYFVLVFASPTLEKTRGSSADKCFNMLSSYLLIFSICRLVLQISFGSVTAVDSAQHSLSLA